MSTTRTRKAFRERRRSHYPNLYHGKTRTIRLTFDLPSGKPRSDSPIRVGQAYAAFTAWAWGDPGLGDVRIVMPPDFSADIQTRPDRCRRPADARPRWTGTPVYTVKDLADPIGW